jgi:hypothetical protein
MLAALQSLYANADYAMLILGRQGASVQSSAGVKQGCPLSPTLFGLLLDGLHRYLRATAPDAGAELHGGRLVPDLGYADDFCLLAASPEDLQRLLDAAHGYLTSIGMELSVDKTRVVVFQQPPPPQTTAPVIATWTCGGQPLQQVAKYKYLGVELTADAGIEAAFPRLHQSAWAAWSVLRRQFSNLHCGTSLALQLDLYGESVPQTASYACEVWGVRRLPRRTEKDRDNLGQLHVQCLQRIWGG